MSPRAWLAALVFLGGEAAAAPHLEVPDELPVQANGNSRGPATASGNGNGIGGGFILLTSYDRRTWSGDIARYDLVEGRVAPTPAWRAAALVPAAAERSIFTTVVKDDGATATVPFVHSAFRDMEKGLVDYLRGDRSGEGKSRRARGSVLGDIVRSVPLVVGAPAHIQGEGYAEFRLRHAGRGPVAYVGANDGMLHAFDVATGVEQLAYIPRALHPSLPGLAQPGYRHRAWVDASPGAGEAHTGDTWRTVLASGYGMGAKGVFAIDITQPDSFASGAGELWQFSDADDGKMGHVFSAPVIARLRISRRDSAPRYRYFAIVTSGLNNYTASGPPDGALFLLALDKPQRERWRINVNYYRLDAPAADSGDANALGPPAVVLAADGSVNYAYAGDLQGRLWRFDFSGPPPWRKPTALFSARDDGGRRQPITAAPRIVYAPGGGHLVLFGTGRLLEQRDTLAAQDGTQSLYAVHDTLAADGAAAGSRGQLAERRMERDGDGFRISGEPVDYAAHKGWYVDLPDSARTGERMTTTPFADGGMLVATTSLSGAGGRTYVLSALSGMAHAADGADAPDAAPITGRTVSGAGLIPPLLLLTSSTAGEPDGTGRARAVRHYSLIPALPGEAVLPPIRVVLPAKRLSWREITNWQELHDAAVRPGVKK